MNTYCYRNEHFLNDNFDYKDKSFIDLLHQGNLQGQIKTIIGGAPITKAYADHIGADAYAFDAAKSVERVNALLGD